MIRKSPWIPIPVFVHGACIRAVYIDSWILTRSVQSLRWIQEELQAVVSTDPRIGCERDVFRRSRSQFSRQQVIRRTYHSSDQTRRYESREGQESETWYRTSYLSAFPCVCHGLIRWRSIRRRAGFLFSFFHTYASDQVRRGRLRTFIPRGRDRISSDILLWTRTWLLAGSVDQNFWKPPSTSSWQSLQRTINLEQMT